MSIAVVDLESELWSSSVFHVWDEIYVSLLFVDVPGGVAWLVRADIGTVGGLFLWELISLGRQRLLRSHELGKVS
jgi:hypothetical protein